MTVEYSKKKEGTYEDIIRQAEALVDNTLEKYTNLSNILSLLKYNLNLFWAGMYWVSGDELKLGPFQGRVACTKIKRGKGACGKAAEEAKTVILKNVLKFPAYIACHSETKSEIVVPGMIGKEVVFVIDLDSRKYNYFDETDEFYLSKVADIMVKVLN
jgi:L-methionine (R)-S-oxide reductase